MWRVLVLIFSIDLLITSCASCQYCKSECYLEKAVPYTQYALITVAPRPAEPKYTILDESKQIYDIDNLRYLGYNIVEMKRFLKDTTDLVAYYEKIAADYAAENIRLKAEADKAAAEHNKKVTGSK